MYRKKPNKKETRHYLTISAFPPASDMSTMRQGKLLVTELLDWPQTMPFSTMLETLPLVFCFQFSKT